MLPASTNPGGNESQGSGASNGQAIDYQNPAGHAPSRDNGIVFASDSQTTHGNSRLPGNKISILEFETGKALVAQSGSSDLSGRAVQILTEKAKRARISDEMSVARLAEESVREVHNHLRDVYQGCDFSADDWQRYFLDQDQYFELLIGHYIGEKPYIYKVNLSWCLAVKSTNYFETSGCGGDLGNYLLKQYSETGMSWAVGAVTATYVVEEVIKHDIYCSAPTRVGVIRMITDLPPNPDGTQSAGVETAWILKDDLMQRICKAISDIDEERKKERTDKILKRMRELGEQSLKPSS